MGIAVVAGLAAQLRQQIGDHVKLPSSRFRQRRGGCAPTIGAGTRYERRAATDQLARWMFSL